MDNQKSFLRSLFTVINLITDVLAALTAAAIFLVVTYQIVGRLSGSPAPWTEEVTRFAFIWLVFLGVGIGFRKVESARVTLFLKYTPKIVRKYSVWIYSIGTIGFFLFMLVYGTELVSQQIQTRETSSALLMPMWIIGLSVPVSAVIGIINVTQSLLYERELI